MNCLDCAANDQVTPAVGVCHGCGAGISIDLAASRDKYLTRTVALNMQIDVEPPAPVLRCEVCNTAVDAVREASRLKPRRRSMKARR